MADGRMVRVGWDIEKKSLPCTIHYMILESQDDDKDVCRQMEGGR